MMFQRNVKSVLTNVYNTLKERGYDPVNKLLDISYLEIQLIFRVIMRQEIKSEESTATKLWKNLFQIT